MADYFSQTVIQPDIPKTAFTALEFKLMCEMFEHETTGEDVYFYASMGPSNMVFIGVDEAKALIAKDAGIASRVPVGAVRATKTREIHQPPHAAQRRCRGLSPVRLPSCGRA